MRNAAHWIFAVLSSAAVSACGGAPPEEKAVLENADPPEVDTAKQPVINGWTIGDESHTGLVKLEVWSVDLNNYFVFCSGTLMTNGWIYSAAHCFDEDVLNGRRPYITMGSQRTRAATIWRTGLLEDIAIVTLETPFDMWNWTGSSYATSPAQINNWQYSRLIHNGSSASLHTQAFLCTGAGPGGVGAPIKFGFVEARWEPTGPSPQNHLHTYALPGYNQNLQQGDSGGGCVTNWHVHQGPIAMTASNCHPAFGFCAGPGPDIMLNFWWAVALGAPPYIVY